MYVYDLDQYGSMSLIRESIVCIFLPVETVDLMAYFSSKFIPPLNCFNQLMAANVPFRNKQTNALGVTDLD